MPDTNFIQHFWIYIQHFSKNKSTFAYSTFNNFLQHLTFFIIYFSICENKIQHFKTFTFSSSSSMRVGRLLARGGAHRGTGRSLSELMVRDHSWWRWQRTTIGAHSARWPTVCTCRGGPQSAAHTNRGWRHTRVGVGGGRLQLGSILGFEEEERRCIIVARISNIDAI
jgi:hypothetical protein